MIEATGTDRLRVAWLLLYGITINPPPTLKMLPLPLRPAIAVGAAMPAFFPRRRVLLDDTRRAALTARRDRRCPARPELTTLPGTIALVTVAVWISYAAILAPVAWWQSALVVAVAATFTIPAMTSYWTTSPLHRERRRLCQRGTITSPHWIATAFATAPTAKSNARWNAAGDLISDALHQAVTDNESAVLTAASERHYRLYSHRTNQPQLHRLATGRALPGAGPESRPVLAAVGITTTRNGRSCAS